MSLRRFFRSHSQRIYKTILVIFLSLNVLSYVGAYALTHYNPPGHLGLGLPRPTNAKFPTSVGLEYITERIFIKKEWLETWFISSRHPVSKGTILLFPGSGGSKGQLLAPAQVFHALDYDALLVDFRGVGGSSGNTKTLGIREAEDVAIAMKYAQYSKFKHPIILYGVSMGSAAILRAIAREAIAPDAIILELPFARLLDAVRSRLRAAKIPTFPIAELLVFWGSIQHRFNGFFHNPVAYASKVKCPTLLFYGKLDKWTTMAEIEELFQNLGGYKKLVLFTTAGHNLLVTVDKKLWYRSVDQFFNTIEAISSEKLPFFISPIF